MIDNQELRIRNLELLLKVKSLILRSSDVDTMLQEVCTVLVDQAVYDVSWVMLINQDGSNRIISSEKDNTLQQARACWIKALSLSGIYEKARETELCKECNLSVEPGSVLLSKRMEYDGEIYGVFSVATQSTLIDSKMRSQFEELVGDIAMAIYLLKLKESKEQFQKELLVNQHTYTKLLDTSSVAMGVIDLNFKVTFMTKSLKEMLGFPPDIDLEKENVMAFDFLAESLDKYAKEILEGMSGHDPVLIKDTVFETRKGTRLQVRLRISLLFNSKKEHCSYMTVFNDMSGHLKTEEALRYSEKQFRRLFMKAPNGVMLLTPLGNIIDCNEAEAEMLMLNRNQIIGNHVSRFLSEKNKLDFDDNFRTFLASGVKEIDVKIRRADGTELEVARKVSAMYDKGGVLSGIIVHSRDISQEVEAQTQIRLLLSAIEQSSSTFTITDLDGNITYVNRKFSKVTGYSKAEVIGQKPSLLKSGLMSDSKYKEIWDKLMVGGVWNGELHNKRKDGSLYWELASMTAVRNEQGEIVNLLKVAEDITSRKMAENELEESNIRYQNIFNLVPSSIVIHINGTIVDINNAALLFSRAKSRDEIVGKHVISFVHESSVEDMKKRMKALADGDGQQAVTNAIYMTTKGDRRNVRTLSKAVTYKGELANMVIFEDVTDFLLAEKKIIESEKKFRNIFNMHPDPVSIAGLKSGVMYEANDAFLRLLNMKREDVIGVSSYKLPLYKRIKDRDKLVALIKENGYLLNFEVVFVINGKEITALVSGAVFDTVEGEERVLFVSRDISERKIMEQELLEAKEKAERGEELKALFLSNMSHEIRTPMNAILGFSDLLRDTEIQRDHRNQYIDIIQKRGKDLLKMISDIMDISKIESNSLELVHRAVKINELMQNVVGESYKRLENDVIQVLEFNYNSTLDDNVLVSGDKFRIKQVFQAVIDNAIKFTKHGKIDLRCWQEKDLVLFEVEDTGIGISEEKLPYVFDSFVQAFNNQEVSAGGTGLGLSLSKHLLNLMGTDISIESTLGKGSKVRFSLRLYDGGHYQGSFVNPQQDSAVDWNNRTILVVEDEPSNQMYIKVILGKTGVNLLMANDGVEAIELFEESKNQIDLILMDIKMPRMNGYIATIKIKRIDPEVPIIALTANAMNNDREEAMTAGCDDYLTKPISREKLFNVIEKHLHQED